MTERQVTGKRGTDQERGEAFLPKMNEKCEGMLAVQKSEELLQQQSEGKKTQLPPCFIISSNMSPECHVTVLKWLTM